MLDPQAADLRGRARPGLPHRRARRDAHAGLPPGRGPRGRQGHHDGPPAGTLDHFARAMFGAGGAHPLAAALLPVHRAVGRVRRLVPAAPRRPTLGRVGRLRHGQPARAARLRHRPGGVLRLRVRHGHRADADVPQRASATCGTWSRATCGSPARSAWRCTEHAGRAFLAARVRRPARRPDRRGSSTTRWSTSASRSSPSWTCAATVQGSLVVGRVLTIEELTGFKKPIRFCTRRRRRGQRHRRAAGDRLRRHATSPRRPGRGDPARRRAARRVRDRRAQDVRPHLRRHDLLGPRAGHRRRPRRHHRAAAGHRGRARRRRPPGASGSTTSCVEVEITPDRGYAMSVRGIARELAHAFGVPFRDPALAPAPGGDRRAGVPGDGRATRSAATGSPPGWCAAIDPTAPTPGLDAPAADSGRHPHDLGLRRRHHQLRDARARPADARLRRRPDHAAPLVVRRADAGREADHPGRCRPACSTAEDMVICDDTGPISLAAVMGGADHRGRRRHDRRAVRGGALGPGDGRPHRPPAQAVQRGGQALGARRRPASCRLVAIERAVTLLIEYGGGTAPATRSSTSTTRGRRRRSRSTPTCPAGWPACRTPPPGSSSCWSEVGCAVDASTATALTVDAADAGGPT